MVSDGELTSQPDTVKVVIVPGFGASTLRQENPPFDPNKPTVVYFGGGDCRIGFSGQGWNASTWNSRANVISFPNGYAPDSAGGTRTYYKYGDMIIVYLSSVARDYKEPIQTIGWSTGGQPAIDVGIRMNSLYQDARYAVNRVTQMDAPCRGFPPWGGSRALYTQIVESFLSSSVDGEQCWLDFYYGTSGLQYEPFELYDILFAYLGLGHDPVRRWYQNSLTGNTMNDFNSGVVAGAYWSILGPGKNLQLARQTDAYYFRWYGGEQSGRMYFYDEAQYPGKLPEPVTLLRPVDVGDPNGAVLTCAESENAVGYQLLFGSDPYRVMDYNIVSDTLAPPNEVITSLPFEETWWTVRVYDQYGSTIHADPVYVDEFILSFSVENLTTGERYGLIQDAIDDALDGDEIILGQGVCHEHIDFKGKRLTVRSTDPNDPAVVAATVISGSHQGSVITMSGSQDGGCVLAGLTITGGTVCISCRDASPTIRNCMIESNGPIAIESWYGCEPIIIDCAILGQVMEVDDPTLVAYWRLDEAEGRIAQDSVGQNDATVIGAPTWQPAGGAVDGAMELDGATLLAADFVLNPSEGPFTVFAWVKGGLPGQAIVSQQAGANWLLCDPATGALMTELSRAGRGKALSSDAIITDGTWHRVGFTWDGSARRLYVDGVLVAEDTPAGLAESYGSLHIGAAKNMVPGTFWSGLIDDVRIYNRVVKP